jgi:hypothetical protein
MIVSQLVKFSSCCFKLPLAWFIFRPWRGRRHVPPKRRLTFNGLHGYISQKTEFFITTAVRTSNTTQIHLYFNGIPIPTTASYPIISCSSWSQRPMSLFILISSHLYLCLPSGILLYHFHHVFQTGSRAHPAYSIYAGSFPGGKAAGPWIWPLTSN